MSFHFLFVMLGYYLPFPGLLRGFKFKYGKHFAESLAPPASDLLLWSSSARVLRMMEPGSAVSLLLPYWVPFSSAGERIPHSPPVPPK